MSHNMTYGLRKRNTKLNYKDKMYSNKSCAQHEVMEIVNAAKSKYVRIKRPKDKPEKVPPKRCDTITDPKVNQIVSAQNENMEIEKSVINQNADIGQPKVFETANCPVSLLPESVWASSMNRLVKQEKYSSQVTRETKSATNSKWVRLNVGDSKHPPLIMSHNMTYGLRKRNTKLNYKDKMYSNKSCAQHEVMEIVNAAKSKYVRIKRPKDKTEKVPPKRCDTITDPKVNQIVSAQNENMEIEKSVINQNADIGQPKEKKAKSKIVRSRSLDHSNCNRIVSTQIQDTAYAVVNKPNMGTGQPKVFETANCPVSLLPESVWASSMNRLVKQEKYSSQVTRETKSATNSKWVRLNVGGKVFQTKTDTLLRYPESFLAGLVNGDPSNEKDISGAYLIDGNPEYFDTILTYLRRGVLNLDANEKTAKDLLCEADFYNIQPLVDEIRKAIIPGPSRTEIVIVARVSGHVSIGEQNVDYIGCLAMSEKRENYEVLQALRQKIEIKADECYYITNPDSCDTWLNIESTLRSFDFVKEEISDTECWDTSMCEKFVRRIFE